jgi:hypothetical protein
MSTSFSRYAAAVITALACFGCSEPEPAPPAWWSKVVEVPGQQFPVPEAWLKTPEGRIAHNLRLPESVPKYVPFDFAKAAKDKKWFGEDRRAAVRYFDHLCKTEAGQWIFKTVDKVPGLYFARPQKPYSVDLADLYVPEAPPVERVLRLIGDLLQMQGGWLIQPPFNNYEFVEQPKRSDSPWQSTISEPYIRLFGYSSEPELGQDGKPSGYYRERTPMQVEGIPAPTARFGYTWRGIRRPHDREQGIAGGELLIYEMSTREVLAVRRQFVIASKPRRGTERTSWELGASCEQLRSRSYGSELAQFAFDVLRTIEPSKRK